MPLVITAFHLLPSAHGKHTESLQQCPHYKFQFVSTTTYSILVIHQFGCKCLFLKQRVPPPPCNIMPLPRSDVHSKFLKQQPAIFIWLTSKYNTKDALWVKRMPSIKHQSCQNGQYLTIAHKVVMGGARGEEGYLTGEYSSSNCSIVFTDANCPCLSSCFKILQIEDKIKKGGGGDVLLIKASQVLACIMAQMLCTHTHTPAKT